MQLLRSFHDKLPLASVTNEVGLHHVCPIKVFVSAKYPLRFLRGLKIVGGEDAGTDRIGPRSQDFSCISQILIRKHVARVGLRMTSHCPSIRHRCQEIPVCEVKNSPPNIEPMRVSIDKPRNNDVAAQVNKLGSPR